MRRAVLTAAGMMLAALPVTAAPHEDGMVRVVLKFVKRDGGGGVRFDPATCPACAPVTDAYWNADNRLETVVALIVPWRRTLELGFDGAAENIRRVLLESGKIGFRREGSRLIVALPPLDHDAITAGEVATHIVEPGMVLRFEHADPARRAGAYASGAFPALQRDAANTLEFAQREVVRRLKLGEEVERRGIGRIQIMGFDTNAPHGHVDAPPHMHMHLRWPGGAGTHIGHYYIGADGLLTHNMVGIKGMGAPDRRFDRGQTFTTIGADDHPAYSYRITEQGWLEIGRAGEAPCVISPLGRRGFADGAHVRCPGTADAPITVHDDLARGVLTVTTGRVVETFRYATDNGALLSPVAPPPAAPSVPPAE
ncbi:hypothetical protein V3I01_04635 [Sphingomonas sp. gentR]|uniref:hypothetical protein n=1 Tax=unclassified Sphingomonas TaxID=196159 RepID=UPI001C12A860|nr:hypothetical protein [Sphingomonas sp. LK11]